MMNRQGIQMAIEAIYRVINSAPKSTTTYPYIYDYASNDVTPQQFNNWLNYLNSILDIAYQNLGLNDFFIVRNYIYQIIQQFNINLNSQNKITYLQLVNQINDVLFRLVQNLLQYLN